MRHFTGSLGRVKTDTKRWIRQYRRKHLDEQCSPQTPTPTHPPTSLPKLCALGLEQLTNQSIFSMNSLNLIKKFKKRNWGLQSKSIALGKMNTKERVQLGLWPKNLTSGLEYVSCPREFYVDLWANIWTMTPEHPLVPVNSPRLRSIYCRREKKHENKHQSNTWVQHSSWRMATRSSTREHECELSN